MGYKKVTTSDDESKLADCPALVTIRVVSGKWKTRILWLLRSDTMQFGELRRQLNGISAKMLTEHLRQLEKDDIIFHRKESLGEIKVSHYGYTNYGSTLIPVLDKIGSWGLAHEQRARDAKRQA